MSATALSASQAIIDLFDDYVIPNYRRQPIALVRGEGSRVWDADGRCYLDLFPGWGCNILGYSPPRLVKAIQEQAARLIHVPNTWYIEQQDVLPSFFAVAVLARRSSATVVLKRMKRPSNWRGCTVQLRIDIVSSRLKTDFTAARSGRSPRRLSPNTTRAWGR